MIDLKRGDIRYFTDDMKKYTVVDIKYYSTPYETSSIKEKFFVLQSSSSEKKTINAKLPDNPYHNLWSTTKKDAVKKKIRQLEKQASVLREMYL